MVAKRQFTLEEVDHIFNKHFRNRLFDVQSDLQDLHELFHILSGDHMVASDAFNLVDRDLSLCRNAISQTISDLDRRVREHFDAPRTSVELDRPQHPPPSNKPFTHTK